MTTKTRSPPKNKKNAEDMIKISEFITQRIKKEHRNTDKNDEIIASRSSYDETIMNETNELKNDHENSKLTSHTPNDSKETTQNSIKHRKKANTTDFVVKIYK